MLLLLLLKTMAPCLLLEPTMALSSKADEEEEKAVVLFLPLSPFSLSRSLSACEHRALAHTHTTHTLIRLKKKMKKGSFYFNSGCVRPCFPLFRDVWHDSGTDNWHVSLDSEMQNPNSKGTGKCTQHTAPREEARGVCHLWQWTTLFSRLSVWMCQCKCYYSGGQKCCR